MESFVYRDFGEVIEKAESLGWIDDWGDSGDPDYDADAVEQDALDFIKTKGVEPFDADFHLHEYAEKLRSMSHYDSVNEICWLIQKIPNWESFVLSIYEGEKNG